MLKYVYFLCLLNCTYDLRWPFNGYWINQEFFRGTKAVEWIHIIKVDIGLTGITNRNWVIWQWQLTCWMGWRLSEFRSSAGPVSQCMGNVLSAKNRAQQPEVKAGWQAALVLPGTIYTWCRHSGGRSSPFRPKACVLVQDPVKLVVMIRPLFKVCNLGFIYCIIHPSSWTVRRS